MDKSHDSTLRALDALIAQVRERLSANREYVELQALEKARADIVGKRNAGEARSPSPFRKLAEEIVIGRFKHGEPSQTEAVAAALDEAGEPLTIAELVIKAKALGARVGGKNPRVNLGTTLSKGDRFKAVRWKGEMRWWFADRPLPSATSYIHVLE